MYYTLIKKYKQTYNRGLPGNKPTPIGPKSQALFEPPLFATRLLPNVQSKGWTFGPHQEVQTYEKTIVSTLVIGNLSEEP